ncbi:hypothetical protein VP01_2330g1 [Puccinia sorghi]|uniref:Uncharacterized protein n=1 Tax=Puccinia sorghi TaxID=27349 RepID=A0A0L6V872_9BASI|nr:hypothetical protein VP01_2330g1 [Puccinia sorghi]
MPTPVSTFSPFTPFTPGSSAHCSGSYFDRPAAGSVGISSPLARRPDMRNHGSDSASLLRMSRVSATVESPRPQPENGWRMASRMKDEAWSAWEQQLGTLSRNSTKNIDLSPKPLRPSNKVNLIHNHPDGVDSNKRRAAVTEAIKASCNPPQSAPEFMIAQMAPGPCRSISSHCPAQLPKLAIKRSSFDPSFPASRV